MSLKMSLSGRYLGIRVQKWSKMDTFGKEKGHLMLEKWAETS